MMSPFVISFSGTPLRDQAGAPDPKQVVEGDPKNRTKTFFVSSDGKFVSGIWKSTPGRWRALPGKDEFCYIVEGHLRLIADSGEIAEFRAGDSFVVPDGFSGFWEIIEETVKHYAIRKYP